MSQQNSIRDFKAGETNSLTAELTFIYFWNCTTVVYTNIIN